MELENVNIPHLAEDVGDAEQNNTGKQDLNVCSFHKDPQPGTILKGYLAG